VWQLRLDKTCDRRRIGSEGPKAELKDDGVRKMKRMLEERLAAQGIADDVAPVVLYTVSGSSDT
jgi:hypothetical protein